MLASRSLDLALAYVEYACRTSVRGFLLLADESSTPPMQENTSSIEETDISVTTTLHASLDNLSFTSPLPDFLSNPVCQTFRPGQETRLTKCLPLISRHLPYPARVIGKLRYYKIGLIRVIQLGKFDQSSIRAWAHNRRWSLWDFLSSTSEIPP